MFRHWASRLQPQENNAEHPSGDITTTDAAIRNTRERRMRFISISVKRRNWNSLFLRRIA